MGEAAGLIRISVAQRPALWCCVDPERRDAQTRSLLAHGWIDDPALELLLEFARPGARVLDVGCGAGVFALAAAAAGAEVVATESTPERVERVRRAAGRNGLERLRVIHAATGDVDALLGAVAELTAAGAERVDAVRLGRPTAGVLAAVLAARGGAGHPPVLFECDACRPQRSPRGEWALRRRAARLGVALHLVDRRRPGSLVRVEPGDLQPDGVCAYAAMGEGLARAEASGWRIEAGLSRAEITMRLIEEAAERSTRRRARAAALLSAGAPWLLGGASADPARAALAHDLDAGVRACARPAAAAPAGPAPERSSAEAAEASEPLVLARACGIALAVAGEEVLRDAHLHVRGGQFVGVLADGGDEGGPALLAALAGLAQPSAGELAVAEGAILAAGLEAMLEPGLSVAENLELIVALLDGELAEVDRRMAVLGRRGGFAAELPARLGACPPDVAARLILTAALECAPPARLILIGRLEGLAGAGPALRGWWEQRARERLRSGAAIVQLAGDPRELPPGCDRIAWLSGGHLCCQGHPRSLALAWRRRARAQRSVHDRGGPAALAGVR